ncbi:PopZ family protein [Bradyrhizobium sp.]|uniref:PopZ family protein n=1 Tax=Bradyrhizobium sp. TaxID=376 RepID=UPI003C73B09F
MTQPAKVQEPSMEEILASIRRIIADDDAKPANPPVAAKPEKAAPAARAPVMKDIPPSAIPAAQAKAAAAPKPAPKPAPAPPPAAASNNQDDIDAMLASLDAATPEADIRPPQPDGEVFELTDDMAVPDPPPAAVSSSFHKIEPQDDLEFTETGAAKALNRQPAYEPPPFESAAPPPQILSRTTVSAVESAFNSLANTVLSNNARTLEDLVKEMLRPLLKSWLDDNLPGMVERIVKAEIERVSRGR